MGAQAKDALASNSMQRVKVYRLNDDGKWDDQGTGHVSVDYLERSEDLGLIVIDEEDHEALLLHRISSDEIYRRQEDTIISWRDANFSTDLALSFQEAVGCSYIWDQITGIQRDLQFAALGNERLHMAITELRKLPSVHLSTLPMILKTVVESSVANQMQVAELILQDNDFFPRLFDLFKMNEDLGNMDVLHMISKLIKGMILLNSPQIFDKIFGDEFIMDVIGALEYDPEVSEVQQHRAFLKEHVIFKEEIPIKGLMVLSKIHQTYRINYIKDVILPRILDEGTIANLNSIINANNAAVVSSLKDDTSFVHQLFAKMKSSNDSAESKKNLVFFLQEFCSLSKSLQLVQQLRLFRDLASEGVFDIVTVALQSHDRKLISAGTDILILFLNQDPNLLRTYVTQLGGLPLLGILVKGVISEFGDDVHCQFLEIIRILLDSYSTSTVSQRDTIVEIFYENYLDQLIEVITSSCVVTTDSETSTKTSLTGGKTEFHSKTKPEILSNICELLCFCVLHHPYRIKCNFLLNNVIEKVLQLTCRREKYLVVSAIRFMRTIISCKDEHLFRHIAKNNLFKPVIDAFVSNGDRYNMLHSGVLDLLEYIRRENMKTLIKYVFEGFWKQLSRFESLGTIQQLKIKYEQSLDVYDVKTNNGVAEQRKHSVERGLEKEEEDYFNDSDEEDSTSVVSPYKPTQGSQPGLANGTDDSRSCIRTGSVGLVDYDDDDDDDYNPPPRKLETSVTEEDIILRPVSSRKIVSPRHIHTQDLELKKKRKLDSCRSNNNPVVAAACSTSTLSEPQGNSTLHFDTSQAKEEDTKSDEQRYEESGSSSNGLARVANISQSKGEDSSPLQPISGSSPEISVKSAGVATSDPYPVR